MNWLGMAAASAAIFLASGAASAATVEVDETVDLAQAVLNGTVLSLDAPALSLFDVTLTSGDTLVLKVNFLPGQELTVGGLKEFIGGARGSDLSTDTTSSNVSLAFFDALNTTLTLPGANSLSTASAFAVLSQSQLSGAPTTFAGFRLTMDVQTAGASTLQLTQDDFALLGDSFSGAEFAGHGAAPEPESWALMLTGFLASGAMIRRRRAAYGPV